MNVMLPGAAASHFVALDTYGVEKVMLSQTRQRVPALKCTRAVPAIVQRLFGSQAVDVTPPRASYTYLQLAVPHRLKNNYLVLRLTDEELAQVETLTRQQPLGAWVYLWRDGHWLEFPCGSHADYRLASATNCISYPRFPGPSAPALCPSALAAANPLPSEITLEQSGDWWWIGGDTYPHRDLLRAAGARWSKKRRQWYVIGPRLPDAIRNLAEKPAQATETTAESLSGPVAEDPRLDEEPSAGPGAVDEPGDVSLPVVDSPAGPVEPRSGLDIPQAAASPVVPLAVPVQVTPDESPVKAIPQVYVGRVNVVGDGYCLGVVLDRRPPSYKNIPIYLSVAGPATSVEAVWARLSQGKETTVVPDQGPAIYLEPNKAGLYVRYQKKIEALGIDHLILIHEDMAEPGYPTPDDDQDPATTYLLRLSEAQARAKLGEHVRKTVKIAVFDPWFDYLETEGRRRGLVRECSGYGLNALAVRLDASKWTDVITSGLAAKRITFGGDPAPEEPAGRN